ncbi:MAG: hypothetical protein AAF682_14940 [Planctomycetota bacterium]
MRAERVPRVRGYRFVRPLESGGSRAELFVARPTASKRRELAKKLGRDALPDLAVVKVFRFASRAMGRELKAVEGAESLGRVLEHDFEDGERPLFWYAMPYVEGPTLDEVIAESHTSSPDDGLDEAALRRGLRLFCKLLDDLERFHERGFWHKDVKPANVIVGADGVRLVDVGLLARRDASILTEGGTPAYRDPELERRVSSGLDDEERSADGALFDLYGVAASLHHYIDGFAPRPRRPLEPDRETPLALRAVLQRASTPNLGARYRSAAEMRRDLEALYDAVSLRAFEPKHLPSFGGASVAPSARRARGASAEPARAPATGSRRPTPRRPGRWSLAAAALAVVATLAAAVATGAVRGGFTPVGVGEHAALPGLPTGAELEDDLRATRAAGAWIHPAQCEPPFEILLLPAHPGPAPAGLDALAEGLSRDGTWRFVGEGVASAPADAERIAAARAALGSGSRARVVAFLMSEGLAGLLRYERGMGEPDVFVASIFSAGVGRRICAPFYELLGE